MCVHTGHQAQWGLATATTTNEADDDDKSFCTNSVTIVFLSFFPSSCKLIRLYSHSSLHCSFSSLMFVTFLGISSASLSLCLSNSLSYFTLMSFIKKKRAFMFSHFFTFIFCFQLFRFHLQQQQQRRSQRDAIQQRERERLVCWIQRSLSRALFFSFTLFRARSCSLSLTLSRTQLCWQSENIKNARETFC